jgi:hypothetical protein
MTSHKGHNHPATPAARAACRNAKLDQDYYQAIGEIARTAIAINDSRVIHEPIINRNTRGAGIATYISCTCGWEPKNMPQRMSTRTNAHQSHLRQRGAAPVDYSQARYATGLPAAGMTWDQWYAANPTASPTIWPDGHWNQPHCSSCGTTDLEALTMGDQGYTACCNKRGCQDDGLVGYACCPASAEATGHPYR